MLSLRDHVLSAESYAVRLAMALLQLPYERVAVDAYPGHEHVPILSDGEVVLRDTDRMLVYLARICDPTESWLPQHGAAEIERWLAFAVGDLSVLNEARKAAAFGAPGDLNELNSKGWSSLRLIDDHLSAHRLIGLDWMAGARPSMADVALFPAVALSHDSGIGHEDFPAINLWQRRIRRLPGFVGMPGIPDYC